MLLKLLKPTAMRRVTPLLNQNINSRLPVSCIRNFRVKADKSQDKIPKRIEHNDRVKIDSNWFETRQINRAKKRVTEKAAPQINRPISREQKIQRPEYQIPEYQIPGSIFSVGEFMVGLFFAATFFLYITLTKNK